MAPAVPCQTACPCIESSQPLFADTLSSLNTRQRQSHLLQQSLLQGAAYAAELIWYRLYWRTGHEGRSFVELLSTARKVSQRTERQTGREREREEKEIDSILDELTPQVEHLV
jgi:hypothetical protein